MDYRFIFRSVFSPVHNWSHSTHSPFKSSFIVVAVGFNFVFAFDAKIVNAPNRSTKGRLVSKRKANGKRRTAIKLMEVNSFFACVPSIFALASVPLAGAWNWESFKWKKFAGIFPSVFFFSVRSFVAVAAMPQCIRSTVKLFQLSLSRHFRLYLCISVKQFRSFAYFAR